MWTRDFALQDAICLTLVTEGFAESHKLLGFNYSDTAGTGTILIKGGDPTKSEKYSELCSKVYKRRAVPMNMAAMQIANKMRNKKLIVTYNLTYVNKFLKQLPEKVTDKFPPMLNIAAVYHLVKMGVDLSKCEDIQDLCDYVDEYTSLEHYLGFKRLSDIYCESSEGSPPKYKYNVEAVYTLFINIFNEKNKLNIKEK